MTTATAIDLQHRFVEIQATKESEDLLEFSFSSEEPVKRYFGDEVLDHDEESVDLTRLNSGTAPLLFNHNQDIILGRVHKAFIQDRKGRAVIEWASNPKALEVRKDVEAGILRGISVGYTINQAEQEEETTRAISWTPHELSIVAIPADFKSVGIGRSLPSQKATPKEEPKPMSYVTDYMEPQTRGGEFEEESRQFSIIEAAKGIAHTGGLTGRELEVNQELERRNGRRTQGFFVPSNGWSQRAYVAGTASAGGNLVATDLLADNFIEALRNRSVVGELGATMLPSLVGDVAIPKRTGDNSVTWFGADNSDAIAESTGTIGQVTMSPKTVGAFTKFSHLMRLQSTPEIEQVIRSGFVSIIANAIDEAALNGSGSSSQPTGILQTSGIGSVAGGTNGLAPTLDHIIDLKKAVSIDNADAASAAYVTNAKVEAVLSKLKDGNSAYHLSPYAGEIGRQQIASRRFEVTNAIPSNLSKGSGSNLSAILYGNFRDLYIGMFGTTEILVDPFSDFAKATTAIRILQSIDIAVAHPESFAAMKDAIAAS
mgnify:CR=1 FL=1